MFTTFITLILKVVEAQVWLKFNVEFGHDHEFLKQGISITWNDHIWQEVIEKQKNHIEMPKNFDLVTWFQQNIHF